MHGRRIANSRNLIEGGLKRKAILFPLISCDKVPGGVVACCSARKLDADRCGGR